MKKSTKRRLRIKSQREGVEYIPKTPHIPTKKAEVKPEETILRVKYKFNNKPVKGRIRRVKLANGTVKYFKSLVLGDYESAPFLPPFEEIKAGSKVTESKKAKSFDALTIAANKRKAAWKAPKKKKGKVVPKEQGFRNVA